MKQTVSVLAVIVIAMSLPFRSFCQIEKGKFFIGGDVNFSRSNAPGPQNPDFSVINRYEWSKNSSIGFNWEAGYFLTNRIALGLSTSFAKNNSTSYILHSSGKITNEVKANTIGIGPLLRYTHPLFERLYLVADLRSLFFLGNQRRSQHYQNIQTDEPEIEYSGIHLNLRPGITYFLTKRFALEGTLGGVEAGRNFKNKETTDYNFSFSLRLSTLHLGAKFYL